jgi:hypothetical protein
MATSFFAISARQEFLFERSQKPGLHPTHHLALLSHAAHSIGIVGYGLQFDELALS